MRGRVRQKLETRRRILSAATSLVASGRTPTIEEAADAAAVSRRTAYRYFPQQAKLLTEAALEGLRIPMEAALSATPPSADAENIEQRVTTLIERMQSLAARHEDLLRTMIHQTVLERSPPEQPRRGTRRVDWIESALKSLRKRVSAREFSRLVSGLALCGGIEALLVLRDIRGLSQSEAIAVSRWAATALLRQTLADAAARTSGRTSKRQPARA